MRLKKVEAYVLIREERVNETKAIKVNGILTNIVYPLDKLHRPYCALITVFGPAPTLTKSRATLTLLV